MFHYTKQTESLDYHSFILEEGYLEFLFWTVDYWDWDFDFEIGGDFILIGLPFVTITWYAE